MSFNFKNLQEWIEKPEPFTPGEPLFWAEPHISKQMLAVHLDPNTDLASRKHETIDKSVQWICQRLNLREGDAVLDMGCGPGLYASRLAQRGLRVTGVDFSQRSINYARDFAASYSLEIPYRCQDYLSLDDENCYDAVLLIYGDYCTFNSEQRCRILRNVQRALKPGGHFVLDVTTEIHRQKHGATNNWYVSGSGFWRPGEHLVLEQGFSYPELKVYLDQYIVIENDGKMTVYRNWFQDFTGEMITAELEAGGFTMLGLWGDLTGSPYREDSEWIGIVARKMD
jgi:SAM-dependent methyltransferase